MRGAVVVAATCLAFIASNAVDAAGVVGGGDDELVPTGKGWGERPAPGPGPGQGAGQGQGKPQSNNPTSSNGINYHGGPLITSGPTVYYIWYGNWSGNSATTILPSLASSIGGSSYFNINTTYYDASGKHVTNAVHYGGSITDNYSQGTSLTDAKVQAVVASALSSGRLSYNSSAVYFVLTSSDVNESSGFCTQYCGWHTHASISGLDTKYAFVGNPDRCPSACAEQTTGPNGNAGADGMASIISHELEEATTDPDLNAWYDRRGQENADKCAWTFGSESTAANGSKYNVILGGKQYLIQQNWVNQAGGYCGMAVTK